MHRSYFCHSFTAQGKGNLNINITQAGHIGLRSKLKSLHYTKSYIEIVPNIQPRLKRKATENDI